MTTRRAYEFDEVSDSELDNFKIFGDGTTTGTKVLSGSKVKLKSEAATDKAELEASIASETSARASADSALQENIDAEANARFSADSTLQADLATEAASRKSKDVEIEQAVSDEADARSGADTKLQNNISAEATARASADSALQESMETVDKASDLVTAIYGNSVTAEGDARGHKCHMISICKGAKYRVKASVEIGDSYICSENSTAETKRLQHIISSLKAGGIAEFTAEYNAEYVSFFWSKAGTLTLDSVSAIAEITDKGSLAYVGFSNTLSATATGWAIFSQDIRKGNTYKLSCNVGSKVTTVCSIDNATDPGTTHRIETFATAISSGDYVEFTPTSDASYIAIYFSGQGSLTLQQEHTISSCEASIEDIDSRIEVLNKSALNYEGSVSPTDVSGSQSIYGIENISLKNGRTYSIGLQVSSDVTNGNYITLKIANADGSTYKQVGALMKANVPILSAGILYSFVFVATEDVANVKIESYCNTTTFNGAKVTFFVTDVSEIKIRILTDSSNAVDFYPKYYENEIAQLKKDSDVVLAFVSDIHSSSVNFQRVVNVAETLGADAILNGGDTVNNLNAEGLSWYDSIVNASSIPVLTILGNHDCWTSSSPWSWSSAESNYNLIMPTLISQASVIVPDDASTAFKSYWYKDFGNIRIIGLDGIDFEMDNAHHWDSAQQSWFASVLADAQTNNKSVVVMNHYPYDKTKVNKIEKGWNSWRTYLENYAAYDALYTPSSAVSAVKSFIDAGGSFIGWLVGHQHSDSMLTITDDARQFMHVISSAKFSNHVDSTTCSDSSYKEYDCFDLLGIDLTHGFMKMLRLGLDEDSAMQRRKPLTWDFVNHRIFTA